MKLLATLLLLGLSTSVGGQRPVLWAGLDPGPFAVGYRQIRNGPNAVDVWYPAKEDGRPITFRTYLRAHAEELGRFLASRGISAPAIASFVDSGVYAKENASMAAGRYALLLIAQGNGQDAADQAILSESLSGHGYVVVSVPSPMAAHPMTAESQIGAFAEEQADALDEARRMVKKRFPIRPGCEAVIGHSFGARSALLLAMRHREICGIISLDGGIGTGTGNRYLKTAPSFRRDARLPPLLHVYEDLDSFMKPDFGFLEELRFRSIVLRRTADMHHGHFTTYGFAAAAIAEVAAMTKAGPTVRNDIVMISREILEFLDQQLSK